MENGYFSFFVTALTALAVENAVFFRVLGFNRFTLFLKSPRSGILYGGVFTAAAVFSSLPVALINSLLAENKYVAYVRAPCYFICVSAVYTAVFFLTRRFLPSIFTVIKEILPISFFNTALFGAFYVSAVSSFNTWQTVGYAFGGGIGYTISILIVYYARKRLALCPSPRSFRGLPLLLIYIGILSMALYGIIGQGLPS